MGEKPYLLKVACPLEERIQNVRIGNNNVFLIAHQ
jgi:hypothetical protein